MRRNRFEEIMKYFHAADNSKIFRDEKFDKIRSLIDILNENFNSLCSAFGPMNVSIDVSMIPYFGRHPTKKKKKNGGDVNNPTTKRYKGTYVKNVTSHYL